MKLTIKANSNRDGVFDLVDLIKSKYELKKDMKLFSENGEITVSMIISDRQKESFGPSIPDEEIPF